MNHAVLRSIIDDNYRIPAGSDAFDHTEDLMAALGSTDADLREGSLDVLWQWGQRVHFSDEQLIEIGERMAANLSIGLGEAGTDTVFLRAFSSLVLAMVVFVNQLCELGCIEGRVAFLDEARVLRWFDGSLACLAGEEDLRGWIDTAGWAHSIAHMADALCGFARSRYLGAGHLERLLIAIADRLRRPVESPFVFNEDERLSQTAIAVLLRNDLSADTLRRWLDRLARRPDDGDWGRVVVLTGCDSGLNNARLNVRSFLRSLYFQLHIGSRRSAGLAAEYPGYYEYYARPIEARDDLLIGIVGALKAMDRHFYADDKQGG